MNADIKGALEQINTRYVAFNHKGKRMTMPEVQAVLKYGLSKGYNHTGELTDDEVDMVLEDITAWCDIKV